MCVLALSLLGAWAPFHHYCFVSSQGLFDVAGTWNPGASLLLAADFGGLVVAGGLGHPQGFWQSRLGAARRQLPECIFYETPLK